MSGLGKNSPSPLRMHRHACIHLTLCQLYRDSTAQGLGDSRLEAAQRRSIGVAEEEVDASAAWSISRVAR